jgi:hypothetical protein
MFNWLRSIKKQLQAQTTEQKTITVPVKKPFYHEIVQEGDTWAVRIYNRLTSEAEVVSAPSQAEAQKVALSLLNKRNGG